MAGTKEGGLKAAATNYARHGKDFYSRIGQKGGKNGHTGGFLPIRNLLGRLEGKGEGTALV